MFPLRQLKRYDRLVQRRARWWQRLLYSQLYIERRHTYPNIIRHRPPRDKSMSQERNVNGGLVE
jgi:hypothetical protein